MDGMYTIFALLLGPNFAVWPATDKDFYLWLAVEKIHAFTVLMRNI